jgi:uncharacterized protein (TIGR03000 family)
LCKLLILASVAVVIPVPPVWAYINGGVHHSTLKDYGERRKFQGWAVEYWDWLVWDPNTDAFRSSVYQMVGRTLKAIPHQGEENIPIEVKREVARRALETIQEAMANRRAKLVVGKIGSLRYEIGTVMDDSYWETNYGGKRQIHDRRSRLVPFVALRAPKRSEAEARITVLAPADAEIFFDDEATTQKGSERLFITPSIKIGKDYTYEVRARWQEKGKMIEQSRTITISGGGSVPVNFFTKEAMPK